MKKLLLFFLFLLIVQPLFASDDELAMLRTNYIKLLMASENDPDELTALLSVVVPEEEVSDQMVNASLLEEIKTDYSITPTASLLMRS